MGLFSSILSTFREAPIDHPFVVKKRQTQKTKQVKPDNIAYDARNRAYVRTETEDGFEDKIWQGESGQRTDQMLKFDIDICVERGLNEVKYKEMKVYWANEYSAAKVAQLMKGKRGYSVSTLDKYWSAMNHVKSMSPTELERGNNN